MRLFTAALTFALVVGLGACKREERNFRESTPMTSPSEGITVSGLHPAQPTQGTAPPSYEATSNGMYSENAYAVSEGQKLYESYNCVGCHAHGGGAIGPPLMDNSWIYGGEPQNIFATIVQGRPNGMPAFRGKIPDQQVWEIVAYVRSMSGLLRKDVAPGRSDNMYPHPPPQSTKPQPPKGPTGALPR